MKKRVKILEVFIEVDEDNPTPKYAWEFFGNFNTHAIVGLLEHIKSEQLRRLLEGTFSGGPNEHF